MLAHKIDQSNLSIIPRSYKDKDSKSRMKRFQAWLGDTGRTWLSPDLDVYRDHLLDEGLIPRTVKAHLSTIRSELRQLYRQPETRDLMLNISYTKVVEQGHEPTPANVSAFSRELEYRFKDAVDERNSKVKTIKSLQASDQDHLRLTKEQVYDLLEQPDTTTLRGKRDRAMIALAVCTGIRAAELADIKVSDLHQTLMGHPALAVRCGKRHQQRVIPYGGLDWCLIYVKDWLEAAGITAGYVFMGIYKGDHTLRDTKMATRNINRMFNAYPIDIFGVEMTVNPHDLRRTYARLLYEAGVDIVAIQQNMGHAYIKETLDYIGELGTEHRLPPKAF